MTAIEEISFKLILHSGNGRSYAFEAIKAAKEGEFVKAEELLEKARKELESAHHIQTQLLQKEAAGENNMINLLLIHAQDHLMTGITVKEIAEELIDLRRDMMKQRGRE
ncbi:PTS system, cellobiose-specific IIA component [Caldanaerovirga acetigignens]|uniref:PTS system, cellobiose-specific IIA component n=1 Tax=Caldanaerovirga acetigignens TaxID=447595 RepID=A0A1M7IY06_9FIRM|nr:PTS lactose/cellobiose transporter subunit IIA [Caldanaerovirga acetigignens]SHM45714.1 PTS system, cellobiose-specific IIA component [Caldanaerovirga acetigignens]